MHKYLPKKKLKSFRSLKTLIVLKENWMVVSKDIGIFFSDCTDFTTDSGKGCIDTIERLVCLFWEILDNYLMKFSLEYEGIR